MAINWKKKGAALSGVALAATMLTSGIASLTSTVSAKSTAKVTIALLLPDTTSSPRYETEDKPDFTADVKKLDPNATVDYQNAQGDTNTQLQQAESAISNGAKVLVVDPIDGVAAAQIVKQAQQAGVKVIAYDRLIEDSKPDYYVSFNNELVGELQGKWIADHTKKGGTVVMINGAQTDNNAVLFRKGALEVLQPLFNSGKLKLGYQTYTPNWDPSTGQREMEQALTKLNNKVDAILAANDDLAGACIQAMNEQHLSTKNIPVTGQDATDAGLNRIYYQGTQSMTVYKAVPKEAEAAAELAVALATGSQPPKGLVNGTTQNGMENVPSVLLKPVVVTKANVASTVIKDHYTTWARIKNPGKTS
ncbi:sugar ABC transporter substrate-binding protein [Alicyclobacillus acidiphilus]|uniref:sugar ABC transporter substrate-binding protein n=1 Tax=Alicyclobacillus acidiphilus TaxID=182455 RepID=UPI00083321DC|nr:sugar ABC transporter substrate-binding protein [Alicyclobacillus acidiphilus]